MHKAQEKIKLLTVVQKRMLLEKLYNHVWEDTASIVDAPDEAVEFILLFITADTTLREKMMIEVGEQIQQYAKQVQQLQQHTQELWIHVIEWLDIEKDNQDIQNLEGIMDQSF